MSKRNTTLATAFLAGLLGLAPVFAQNQGATAGATTAGSPRNTQSDKTQKMDKKGSMSAQDQKFMMDAAKGGMMEVELGRLAAQKATNADVKAFGQRMVDDHGKANDELKGLASKKSVTLPATMDAKHQAMHDKLAKMKGAAFDSAYMAHMVSAHAQAVALFQKESKGGADPEAKAWAAKTLPTLQEHHKMAQSIAAKLKGSKESGGKN
jgi:putative membrane protein